MNARPMLYDVLGRNFLLTRAARPDIADRSSHFDQCTLYIKDRCCMLYVCYTHSRPCV